MSTYQPNQLWQLWQREEIDSTMVVGHMLQNLVLQQEAIYKLNTSLIQVKQELEQVKQQPKLPARQSLNAKGLEVLKDHLGSAPTDQENSC